MAAGLGLKREEAAAASSSAAAAGGSAGVPAPCAQPAAWAGGAGEREGTGLRASGQEARGEPANPAELGRGACLGHLPDFTLHALKR